MVGTWIDGKTLYERTFVSTVPVTEANGVTAINDLWFDEILSGLVPKICWVAEVISKSNNGNGFLTGNSCWNSGEDGTFFLFAQYLNFGRPYVNMQSNRKNINGQDVYITIRYTKESDYTE